MARKMQVTHGGVVNKAKKIQTVYGGVVKNAKSAWMVSNGLWRKFFKAGPVEYTFKTGGYHYDPAQDPTEIGSWATVSSIYAGFEEDGDIWLSVYSHNSAVMDVGAPSARVILNFSENVDNKTLRIFFNNNIDLDKSGNSLYYLAREANYNWDRTFMTNSWGSGQSNTYIIPEGTYALEIVMVMGRESNTNFDDYGNVTITSITLDGEEILH